MIIISIIIATYNAGRTLNRCLDSIVSQKNDKIEILIIDGGSSDDTMSIVSSYGDIIDYSLSEKDKGIYDAWNKGLNMAKGQWIMFLGSDDYLLPNSINTYLSFLNDKGCKKLDIICGRCKFCNTDGRLIGELGKPYIYKDFSKYMNIVHGTVLHNKRLFDELGAFDINYKICADYEFLLRRPLTSDYIGKPLICIQLGGVSFSYGMLSETFKIKRRKKCSPLYADLYFLFKGILSLSVKKALLCILKKKA